MKYYDVYSDYGVHAIKVTLQCGQYIGSLEYEISGNCKGRDLLDFSFDCYDITEIKELNRINVDCDVDAEEITIWNKAHNDSVTVDYFTDELNEMIVKLEITDFKGHE